MAAKLLFNARDMKGKTATDSDGPGKDLSHTVRSLNSLKRLVGKEAGDHGQRAHGLVLRHHVAGAVHRQECKVEALVGHLARERREGVGGTGAITRETISLESHGRRETREGDMQPSGESRDSFKLVRIAPCR